MLLHHKFFFKTVSLSLFHLLVISKYSTASSSYDLFFSLKLLIDLKNYFQFKEQNAFVTSVLVTVNRLNQSHLYFGGIALPMGASSIEPTIQSRGARWKNKGRTTSRSIGLEAIGNSDQSFDLSEDNSNNWELG